MFFTEATRAASFMGSVTSDSSIRSAFLMVRTPVTRSKLSSRTR